jgi:hypothetical protein
MRVAAGYGHVGLTDLWQADEPRGEGKFLIHEMIAKEGERRPILEAFSSNRRKVDEVVGTITTRLAGADESDMVLAKERNLLRNRFEDDLGTSAKPVKTGKSKQDSHSSTMLHAQAEGAETLAERMQDLSKSEA